MMEELTIFIFLFFGLIFGLLGIYFAGLIGHGLKIIYRWIRRKK